jgi:hypothetical protein
VNHLSNEILSTLLDAPLPSAEAHLAKCDRCAERLAELRAVVEQLRGLPLLEPPRDFSLGPRLVAEPANVVRLRRWYTAARVAGGSLAAVFVLLVGGAAYLDATAVGRLATTPDNTVGIMLAPATPSRDLAGASAAGRTEATQAGPRAPTAAQPAAPASGAQPAPATAAAQAPGAAAGARAVAPAAAPAGREADQPSTDQVIATTSARPLPTLTPAARANPVAAVAPAQPGDPGAPLRLIASVVGVLAALSLLGAVRARHRLRRVERHPVLED